MRLSELIGAEVRDGRGRVLGRVRDVRLVQENRGDQDGIGTLRLEGLLVGPAPARRFGLNRPDVKGPLLFKWLAKWIYGRLDEIEWRQVVSVAPGSIEIRKSS